MPGLRRGAGRQIKAWELSEENGERRVYIYSEAKAKTELQIKQRRCEAYEKALDKLREGLSKPGCVKKFAPVQRRVTRLERDHPPRGISLRCGGDSQRRDRLCGHDSGDPSSGACVVDAGLWRVCDPHQSSGLVSPGGGPDLLATV